MQCYDKDIVPIAFNMLSCMIFCNLAMQLKWRERERKRPTIGYHARNGFLQKPKFKKLYETHDWDEYHKYQYRIQEWRGRRLVEKEEWSLKEFIL